MNRGYKYFYEFKIIVKNLIFNFLTPAVYFELILMKLTSLAIHNFIYPEFRYLI